MLAITGLPYHDLADTFTQQDVDHAKVFADVAEYTARIMSPAHVENVVALACRTALARRGVAHLAIPVDVQEQPVDETKRSDAQRRRTTRRWRRPRDVGCRPTPTSTAPPSS